MKKIFLSFISFCIVISAFAQTKIHSQVDKRIETLGIIARLAGYEEYNHPFAKKYIGEIHTYFDVYKSDTIIRFMQHIRKKGIGYEAVMAMAVNLEFKDGKFSFIDSWKKDLKRWDEDDAIQFVAVLNAFYKRSHFDTFFSNEAPYYLATIRAFDDSIIANFNQSWYPQYYGTKPQEIFNVIIGCGDGGQNYGASINSTKFGKQDYAIMGSWSFDSSENPVFPKDNNYLPTVVHEFNHSFVNPILEKYENNDTLKNSASILFDSVKNMIDQSYNSWQIMINESIVRACVVRYLMANNASKQTVNAEITRQINDGFLWTKSLVDLLSTYESNRNIYPTFKDFYPKIIYFFDTTAKRIAAIKSDYEGKRPTVVSIEPFPNGAQDVAPNLKEMTIHFSQQMIGKGYSFNYGELGESAFPVGKLIGYSDDKKSVKISLNLKPGTEYEMIVIAGNHFKSTEGYPLKNYTIKFKTRKQ